MIIKREIMGEIQEYIERKEYICITGSRQTGKTTLLQLLKEFIIKKEEKKRRDYPIINFEDRTLLFQFEKSPLEFIRSYIKNKEDRTYIFLDEFQYVQDGGQKLKLIFDTVSNLKIFITGSSSFDIQSSIGKYMVGRLLNFTLTPFSFGEYLDAKNSHLFKIYTENHNKITDLITSGKPIEVKRGVDPFSEEFQKLYEEYCLWGGFPQVVLTENIKHRKKILTELLNNYLLKDINFLLKVPRDSSLILLLQHLSGSIGNLISYQNLGERSGLEYRKIKQYLNILFQTFICYELRPFFKKKNKEISRNPKIYFSDLGFRNVFLNNFNPLDIRSDSGAIIENAALSGLKRVVGDSTGINFWRTKAGSKVDFVLRLGPELIPVEVKYRNFKSEKITRSFYSFIDTFKPRISLVLTKSYAGYLKKNTTEIYFFPVYYL